MIPPLCPPRGSFSWGQEVTGGLWENLRRRRREALGKAGHWGVWHSQEMASDWLSQAQASLQLPSGPEAGAGQGLSRLITLRCARLPPQLGLLSDIGASVERAPWDTADVPDT